MIEGRDDRYVTIAEFAAMIGRSPKTIANWGAAGKLPFVRLCGVPLISVRAVEDLIESSGSHVRIDDAEVALSMMNRGGRKGRGAPPSRGVSR